MTYHNGFVTAVASTVSCTVQVGNVVFDVVIPPKASGTKGQPVTIRSRNDNSWVIVQNQHGDVGVPIPCTDRGYNE